MNRAAAALLVATLGLFSNAFALTGTEDSPVGILDTLGPEVSAFHVSQALAAPGETVTISFTVSEALDGSPRVTVNGHLAFLVSQSGNNYTYRYEVQTFDPSGLAEIQIDSADQAGNVGSYTDESVLSLDTKSLPLRTGLLFVALAAVGVLFVRRLRRASWLVSLSALCIASTAFAQAPEVSNVSFVQQPRESGGTEVVITYDLVSLSCSCDITVSLSKSAGVDGFPYPVTSVSGDTTVVSPGAGKQIVWDIAADYPGEYIPQAQLRVTAEARPTDLSAWQAISPAYIFAYSAQCQNNLKQGGIMLSMFTNESAPLEYYPKLADEPGRLMFSEGEIFPEFCTFEPEILTCPGRAPESPEPYFEDTHYVYLGYLLSNDEDVLAFADAYIAEVAAGGDFSDDLPGTPSYWTGDTIFRLREGIARYLVTDINDPNEYYGIISRIPVMFDWPDNHQTGWGGNVLFLDGHVEFRHYPDEFPMMETTISTLAALAGYEPPTQWNNPYLVSSFPLPKDPYSFVRACANNMKYLGLALKMFANESVGQVLPPLSTERGRLMMTEDIFYPTYLTNPGWLTCPGQPEIEPEPYFDDSHYAYLGYGVLNDADVTAFVSAYNAELDAGGDFAGDLPVATSYGTSLLRLKKGVEQSLIVDMNSPTGCIPSSKIPILFEWPDNHEDLPGGNVLYLDGHVEWQNYPGEFPMTENTVAALAALANRSPVTAWAGPNPVYTLEQDPYGLVGTCGGNLKRAGIACLNFEDGSAGGAWPKLSNVPGRLMYSEDEVYPDYLINPDVLICPGPAPVAPKPYFGDEHYIYFGYMLLNDADVNAFATAYAAEIASGGDFTDDLPGASSYGDTLLRLRKHIQYYEIVDINNPYIPPDEYIGDHEIPVMMEWPGQHDGLSGGHVLYKDGHTEWHDYPGKFPMTEDAVATFDSVATWHRTTAWATRPFTLWNDPHLQGLCQHNVKQLGITMKTFANDSEFTMFPQLSNVPGTLMFDPKGVVPFHLNDLVRLNCPGSSNACLAPVADDHSYAYLGYVVLTDADVITFASAYTAEVASGGGFSRDLPSPVSYGDILYRVREGVERIISDEVDYPTIDYVGQHEIPIIVEWPDNHGDVRGGNVLYMDGHSEWLDYPGEFPMTETTMAILTNLAGRPPIE